MTPAQEGEQTRRSLLSVASVAAASASIAGCLSGDDTGTDAGEPDGSTDETGSDDTDPSGDDQNDEPEFDPGIVTVESTADFEETVESLETAIDESDLTLMTTVDHAENAAGVDERLPSTTLFIFGNPAVGTPLMQESRTIGMDLPQKLLVWEDDEDVRLSYNDPAFLARRHGIDPELPQIEGASEALAALAETAADESSDN